MRGWAGLLILALLYALIFGICTEVWWLATLASLGILVVFASLDRKEQPVPPSVEPQEEEEITDV